MQKREGLIEIDIASLKRPVLTTTRLTLDYFIEADVSRLSELCCDPKIAQTTLAIPHPYTEADAQQWIESQQGQEPSHSNAPFAIRLTATGELIGCIGLSYAFGHRRAEIGYWVGVPYWGNGYCTEAAREVIRFGFEILNLNAITCGYFVGNDASQRVMQKLGITYEGVRRQHYFRHGKFVDLSVGTLLREEWEITQ